VTVLDSIALERIPRGKACQKVRDPILKSEEVQSFSKERTFVEIVRQRN
jgi:hypothetical protein